ncbi:hypothetical protein VTN77DRAFT_6484 [Rasamsonia byssochlamydoides]|uniref:uncharacterized protein n=1 Tax=Rasamsonia byssochlamydoides TaxID=89139 RepID=UPI00374443E8
MKPSGLLLARLFFSVVSSQTTTGCCNQYQVCGYGPEYCAASVCNAAGSANGTCAQLSECDPGVYPGYGTKWGPEYAASELCPLHVGLRPTSAAMTLLSLNHPAPSLLLLPVERWDTGKDGTKIVPVTVKMPPEEIPIGAYTHLNFAFLYIDPTTYEIVPMETNQTDLYSRFTALKKLKAGLQTWISIGGWSFTDPGPTATTFSELAASTSAQSTFFSSLTSFLVNYDFDGVDIDWEYPGAPDRNGSPDDVASYVTFLQNLRSALDGAGDYGLSITLPSSYYYMQYFDIVNISQTIDWFNVMTYDLYGTWDETDPYTGAYVYADTNLTETILDMDLLWRNNIDPSKVNLGIGFYGRSYTLSDPSCTAPGCPFSAGGNPGPCTQSSGILSYDEIVSIIESGNATVVLDTAAAVEIAIWDSNQWVGYDDPKTLQMKLDYANSRCLGGGTTMVWAVDLDDSGTLSEALSNSTDLFPGNGTGTVYIGPSLWSSTVPTVACTPPCTMILPPYPLGESTVISWPPLTTSVLSSSSGSLYTKETTIPVEPFTITQVPFWPVTVPNNATPTAQIIPDQSIMPPSFTITLPGTETLFPVSSINYTSIALSGVSPSTATPTGSVSATTTVATPSSTSTIVTPTPYQTGMAPGCTEFYQVQSGDTCYSIEQEFDITADEFDDWNPPVGTNCANGVWLSYYYCIAHSTSTAVPGSPTGPATTPNFYSTSHVVTVQPQPTLRLAAAVRRTAVYLGVVADVGSLAAAVVVDLGSAGEDVV